MDIITDIKLLKNRRTKIVATLGPASDTAAIIKQLVMAEVNIFRLNMSHGEHAKHAQTYHMIRTIAAEMSKPIAVLADLSGPKIRTGKFSNDSITLVDGATVVVTTRDVCGADDLIPTQYKALANDVKPGDRLLLDDGNLELQVQTVDNSEISCVVIYGGILKNNKGMNLPGVNLSVTALTDKDREDAIFALQLGVDFLALSFVRSAADVLALRAIVQQASGKASIIAKIEKPEALEHANAILDAADGIMVARGDLGVELEPEQVPVAQSQLIQLAKKKFKPVIVATQMLESMIEHARPTRAEVTDISHAITLGTDAVMLSAESAAGRFPVAAVAMMDRILRQTESHLWQNGAYDSGFSTTTTGLSPMSISESMAHASNGLARDLMAHAIFVISEKGRSAAAMSAVRPSAPVVVISSQVDTYRKLALVWGVIPILAQASELDDHKALVRQLSSQLDLANTGDTVLLVQGFHEDWQLNCPSVTVISV